MDGDDCVRDLLHQKFEKVCFVAIGVDDLIASNGKCVTCVNDYSNFIQVRVRMVP